MGADAVQEVAIVRDDDHGAVAFQQYPFQPADRVDIEVVGGFVQQHDVGFGEQCLGQQYAQFPAWRDSGHRAVVLLGRNADAEQEFARAGFGTVTVHFGKL